MGWPVPGLTGIAGKETAVSWAASGTDCHTALAPRFPALQVLGASAGLMHHVLWQNARDLGFPLPCGRVRSPGLFPGRCCGDSYLGPAGSAATSLLCVPGGSADGERWLVSPVTGARPRTAGLLSSPSVCEGARRPSRALLPWAAGPEHVPTIESVVIVLWPDRHWRKDGLVFIVPCPCVGLH